MRLICGTDIIPGAVVSVIFSWTEWILVLHMQNQKYMSKEEVVPGKHCNATKIASDFKTEGDILLRSKPET